jgi:TusA-related sulfurtransferase
VPVLIRWKNKLEPGEVLDVHVYDPETYGNKLRNWYATYTVAPKTSKNFILEIMQLKFIFNVSF